jgi:hypothetical protein
MWHSCSSSPPTATSCHGCPSMSNFFPSTANSLLSLPGVVFGSRRKGETSGAIWNRNKVHITRYGSSPRRTRSCPPRQSCAHWADGSSPTRWRLRPRPLHSLNEPWGSSCETQYTNFVPMVRSSKPSWLGPTPKPSVALLPQTGARREKHSVNDVLMEARDERQQSDRWWQRRAPPDPLTCIAATDDDLHLLVIIGGYVVNQGSRSLA